MRYEGFSSTAFGLPVEPAMNHSIYTADRATHLKVVVSVLLVGIAIVAATLTVRLTHPATSAQITATHTVYKPHRSHALTEMAQIGKDPI